MGNFITNSALGKKLGIKGLYITAGACFIALAGAGTAAYNRAVKNLDEGLVIREPSVVKEANDIVESIPKEVSSSMNEFSSAADSDISSAKPAELTASPNVMPVDGEIINPFSGGELVKDETLSVWKTHDGIDIKADVGTQVVAMNHGTVTEIKDDPLWGGCIIIDHGNGLVGHYYSLSKAMSVSEGDTVEAGQPIGAVGDTAECEAAELSHMHFGLKKNGEWVDPTEYVGISLTK